MDIETFEDIKAGDQVVVYHGGVCRWQEMTTVDRVTNTQIIIGSSKFRKKDGTLMNSGVWGYCAIRHLTDEKKQELEFAERQRKIKRGLERLSKKVDSLSAEEVNKLYEWMTPYL